MSGKDLVIPVNQDGHVKAKDLDALGDLFDLPGTVNSRVFLIRMDLIYRVVSSGYAA